MTGGHGAAADLRLEKVEWPNGRSWSRDSAFRVQLTIRNAGSAPVLVWQGSNLCRQCGSVVLSQGSGKPVRLTNAPVAFSGMPAPLELAAGASAIYEILIDASHAPPPGNYDTTIEFENTSAEFGAYKGVWTGKLTQRAGTATVH